jgi:uncharacterized protein DUF1835
VRRKILSGPPFVRIPPASSAGPLPDVVHVVRGDSPAGAVKSAGARRLILLPDNLALGPCSRSAKLHPKVRQRFWRLAYATVRSDPDFNEVSGDSVALIGADGVAEAHARSGGPIFVWGTGTWNDLLMFGWLLDGAGRRGGDWDRVRVAGDLRISMPLGWFNPAQLSPYGRRAQEITEPLRRALLALWRAYTAPTPEHLERLRQTPPPALPTLMEGLGIYASQLPQRVSRSRRLRLPLVDEVLLRIVPARRFVRFPELFKDSPGSRDRWPRAGLYSMITYFGDLFPQARLAAWSVGRNPAIEQIALPVGSDPGGRPYNTSWRLTERGRRLVANGLDGPDDLPELVIGGYSSERAENWCCAYVGSGWRLERW